MDPALLSEFGVKHAVAFHTLNVRHSLEASPSVVALAREIRIGVIAVVCGVTAITVLRTVLTYQNRKK